MNPLICDCKKPLVGVNPDDDQDGRCSRCGFEVMDKEDEAAEAEQHESYGLEGIDAAKD